MSHDLTQHRSEPEIDRLVRGATGPALAVSTRTARIGPTNAAGRDWIGSRLRSAPADPEMPEPEPAVLDAGMPALIRLRDLAESLGAGSRCSVSLTFWTARGVRAAVCDVAFIGVGAELWAVIEFGPDISTAGAHTGDPPPPAPRLPGRSAVRVGPDPAPGDAAILKEIARRIREGQTMRAQHPGGPAVPPGAPPSGADDRAAPCDAGRSAAPTEPRAADEEFHRLRMAKLAHELKTPLSAIVAAAEIMRDERLGPIENARYRSYAADIFDSARHALMVIGNMLGDATAGIAPDRDAALPAMVFTEVDLNAVAESCVSSMRPLAEAAGLRLSADLAAGLPHVVADSTSVRQIALNLLNNAVKFTAPGGEIGLATGTDGDGRVELVIHDTGRGMTAGEIADASSPPERTVLTRREGGGLGIGLPLVGSLARANGAGIAIASEPLRGTTVRLTFAKDRVVPV